jgi:hypothetical protein
MDQLKVPVGGFAQKVFRILGATKKLCCCNSSQVGKGGIAPQRGCPVGDPAHAPALVFLFSEQKRKSGGMPPFLTLRGSQLSLLIDFLCKVPVGNTLLQNRAG